MLRRTLFSRRTLVIASSATLLTAAGGYYYLNSGPTYPPSTKETRRPPPPWTPPTRAQMLETLKASGKREGEAHPEEFDLLIVGGGATGAGVAVDAASRGLKVALVERDDFSSGMFLSRPRGVLRWAIRVSRTRYRYPGKRAYGDRGMTNIRRNLVQVDETGTWRRTIPAEGGYGTRL